MKKYVENISRKKKILYHLFFYCKKEHYKNMRLNFKMFEAIKSMKGVEGRRPCKENFFQNFENEAEKNFSPQTFMLYLNIIIIFNGLASGKRDSDNTSHK